MAKFGSTPDIAIYLDGNRSTKAFLKQSSGNYVFPNTGTITLPAETTSGQYLLGVPAAYNSTNFTTVFKGICSTKGTSSYGFSMYTASTYFASMYSFRTTVTSSSGSYTGTLLEPYTSGKIKSVILSCQTTSSIFPKAVVTSTSVNTNTKKYTINFNLIGNSSSSVTVHGLVYFGF